MLFTNTSAAVPGVKRGKTAGVSMVKTYSVTGQVAELGPGGNSSQMKGTFICSV